MTEAEYMAAQLRIDDTGIWLGDHHIMPSAEDGLIQADVRRLCDEHNPRSVLELGFGLGLSATAFQDFGIDRHVIIEAHPTLAEGARDWVDGRAGIEIIEGFAQTVPSIGQPFDLVFDDRYELVYDDLDVSRFVHRHYWQCPGYGLEPVV